MEKDHGGGQDPHRVVVPVKKIVQYRTLQYIIVQCSIIGYSTVEYGTVQCSVVQYS
jgi:hypothetical protein